MPRPQKALSILDVVHTLSPICELSKYADSNAVFQCLLAKKLKECGKPVSKLTIDEALKICSQASAEFNQKI